MHHVRVLFGFVFTLLCLATASSAQTSSLTGRVVDPQGATVAGAEVVLVSGRTTKSVRSTADGTFTFENVPAGSYELLVVASGFANRNQAVTVGAGAAPLTVALELGGVKEDVTVQGALTASVTTGKTNAPLRDIPMTVNRVSEQLIREQGVNDLVGALENVAGVNPFTQYGIYEGYTFRGFLDLFPPTAAQLLDGVRNETTNRINTQLSNIERIEVLKGPASALYGGGALGATVNLIRKKPSEQPAFDFSAAAGSWNQWRGTFGATGRLSSDALLYRLDVGADTREGYRHNDAHRFSVTPSIAWGITRKDQLNVYYTFNRDQFDGDAGIPLLNTDFGSALPESVYPEGVPRDRNYRTPQDDATSYDNNLQVAYARQLTDAIGFRNTLSYRHLNDEYFIAEFLVVEEESDVYREFLQFKHHRRPLTNQAELTMRFSRGVEQTIVAGWEGQRYYNHTDTIAGGGVAEAEYIDLYNPVETQEEIDPPLARIRTFNDHNNAFYAQDHISFGTRVKALVGGRVDMYRHHRYDERLDGGVPAAERHGETLKPILGRQVEFGQRFHLPARVDVNTVVYYQVRENYAFSRPGGVFDQASEAWSRGFELDVTTAPAANWRINGGYAFTHAELGDYMIDDETNLKGLTPVFAPRHIFNVWTAYDWANGFGVNVGGRVLSSQYGDRLNVFKIDSYGLLNAAVRYTRGPVEYALNINNLTDTEYYASTLYDTQVYPGEPINVLGTVRVRFR